MDKNFKIVIFLGLVLLVLVFLLILPKQNQQKRTTQVCFDKNCFEVEVAKTVTEHQRGLMFRQHLDKDKGMFFVFEKEGNYPFWMKDTLIPLDMIWINENREVVFIKENAEPCHQIDCPIINPNQNAKYVLEINGGIVKDLGLKIGDKVTIDKVY